MPDPLGWMGAEPARFSSSSPSQGTGDGAGPSPAGLCVLQGGRLCCLKNGIQSHHPKATTPKPPSQSWHVPVPRLAGAAQGGPGCRADPAAGLPWPHKEQLFPDSSWMCKKPPLWWRGGSSSSSYPREAQRSPHMGIMGPGGTSYPTQNTSPKPQQHKEAAEAQSRASLRAGSRVPSRARRGFLCRR